jgi:hypothetical protein
MADIWGEVGWNLRVPDFPVITVAKVTEAVVILKATCISYCSYLKRAT